MFNRWLGIITITMMVIANAAVVFRDIVPRWLVSDPPPSVVEQLRAGAELRTQVGIFDDNGKNLGRSWTSSKQTTIGGVVTIETTTVLGAIALAQGITLPPARIVTRLTFRKETGEPSSTRDEEAAYAIVPAGRIVVDELEFHMHGLGIPISLKAESMPEGDFPFEWQIGQQIGKVVLDSRAPAALGDVIRPFDRLPNLYEGRRWKMDLLDPLAQMLPNVDTSSLGLDQVYIEVTGREVIEYQGVPVRAFVVEGGGAKAWVDPGGRVLRQEVQLPLLGRLVLLDEPYDERMYMQSVRTVPDEPARAEVIRP